jgi:hypothetical protein
LVVHDFGERRKRAVRKAIRRAVMVVSFMLAGRFA